MFRETGIAVVGEATCHLVQEHPAERSISRSSSSGRRSYGDRAPVERGRYPAALAPLKCRRKAVYTVSCIGPPVSSLSSSCPTWNLTCSRRPVPSYAFEESGPRSGAKCFLATVRTDSGQLVTHPIYLDYQATTPLDPRVREAMRRLLGKIVRERRHSHSHASRNPGARRAVHRARAQVATALGADDSEMRVHFRGNGVVQLGD